MRLVVPAVSALLCSSCWGPQTRLPSDDLFLRPEQSATRFDEFVLAPAALNIGLNFVLIPRHGMMGAAWSTLLAYPVLLGLTLWLLLRGIDVPRWQEAIRNECR